MREIQVSWETYYAYIEQLADQIYRSGWQFESILCLARGGLRIGDVFSRMFHKPLAILAAASYQGKNQQDLVLAPTITMTTATLLSPLLLVDDLVDSGKTIQQTIDWLQTHYTTLEIKTAVIWYKAHSIYTPNYYVEFVADHAWICQPFEVYESWQFPPLEQEEKVHRVF